MATLNEQPVIDVTIDGADEVDPDLSVVKGRGGALLREKMVEMASKKFVCIVDQTKLVDGLGGSKLAMPVEIVQFCHLYTLRRLTELPEIVGCDAKLRMLGDEPFVTDNGNYIVDLYFQVRDGREGRERFALLLYACTCHVAPLKRKPSRCFLPACLYILVLACPTGASQGQQGGSKGNLQHARRGRAWALHRYGRRLHCRHDNRDRGPRTEEIIIHRFAANIHMYYKKLLAMRNERVQLYHDAGDGNEQVVQHQKSTFPYQDASMVLNCWSHSHYAKQASIEKCISQSYSGSGPTKGMPVLKGSNSELDSLTRGTPLRTGRCFRVLKD
eukprot:366010-Chlamydomonas_euryale.AAC.3